MPGFPTPSLTAARRARDCRGPKGFTLVELLVASTIGLIVMGSLATLLGLFSRTASSTQSVIDMTHRLRVVGDRLRKDLAGVTCKVAPPVAQESDSGYFEIIEGPIQDAITINASNNAITKTATEGDTDDGLLLTTRSAGEPFIGKYGDEIIQSQTVEVAWFVSNGNLYRRQLLVLPYVPRLPFNLDETKPGVNDFNMNGREDVHWNWLALPTIANPTTKNPEVYSLEDLYLFCDLSVRRDIVPGPLNAFMPNTLGDLTRPINRFRHSATFPHAFIRTGANRTPDVTSVDRFNWVPPLTFDEPLPNPSPVPASLPSRAGEDVVLRNVLSFDVRVFDPDVPLRQPVANSPLQPGDPGYVIGTNIITGTLQAAVPTLANGTWNDSVLFMPRGAYVDLGWGLRITPVPTMPFDIAPATITRRSAPPQSKLIDNRFPGSEDDNKDGDVLDTEGMSNKEDLNNNFVIERYTTFQGNGMQVANVATNNAFSTLPSPTYDTWSTHYESNGINDDSEDKNANGVLDAGEDTNGNNVLDGDSLIDEGNDGIDQPTIDTSDPKDGIPDIADGIPDDPAERETSPPYPVPLRGIEIRIRCIEPTTKEIRQITIRHAFDQS
jgi:prepilin-type N-terminal cleavage/methylation domain-containing protein